MLLPVADAVITDSMVFCVLVFSVVSPVAVTVTMAGRATVSFFSTAVEAAQVNNPNQHLLAVGAVVSVLLAGAFVEATFAGAAASVGCEAGAGGGALTTGSAAQLKRPNQHLRDAGLSFTAVSVDAEVPDEV